MARINNDITIILSEEERETLTKSIKICEQISDDIRYSENFVFSTIASYYHDGKLPMYIFFD